MSKATACCSCGSLVAAGDGAFDSLIADQNRTTGRQQRAQTPGAFPCVCHASYSYSYLRTRYILHVYSAQNVRPKDARDIVKTAKVDILCHISDS